MPNSLDRSVIDNYPVVIGIERAQDGRQRFAAWPLDLPGCIAPGASRSEARERLKAIMPAYLEALTAKGVPVPEPTEFPRVFVGPVGFYDPKTGYTLRAEPGELADLTVQSSHGLKGVQLV